MSPFTFRPATPGEFLLQFLSETVLGAGGILMPESLSWSNAIGGRGQVLQDFVIGIAALNLTARLIKKAQRTLELDDSSLHHDEMVRFFQQTLGLVDYSDDTLNELARQCIYAAKASKRPISTATKRKVRAGKVEVECYLCGSMCIHKSVDSSAAIYYEHLWPSSYGGDSIEDNLLPSCCYCNNAKEDMLLWQTGAVFSFVLRPNPSKDERTRIKRREKVARRMQDILETANQDQCTLKAAAIKIGPAKFENIVAIDVEDAIDYFNLEFN